MLITTLRSGFAGLAGKAIFLTRAFATSPIHHKTFTLADAFKGGLNMGSTPELVTAQGLHKLAKHSSSTAEDRLKHAASRTTASLQHADAHNCNLSFTVANLWTLPDLTNDSWQEQAHAAMAIVEHEQSLALARAGISGTWCTLGLHTHPSDLNKVGIAFRLPGKEDPKAFEARLRAAGLVGGEFKVCHKATAEEFWERVVELREKGLEITPEGEEVRSA